MTISAKRMLFNNPILTDAQLRAEIEKCEFCEEKPWYSLSRDCSPADFISGGEAGDAGGLPAGGGGDHVEESAGRHLRDGVRTRCAWACRENGLRGEHIGAGRRS